MKYREIIIKIFYAAARIIKISIFIFLFYFILVYLFGNITSDITTRILDYFKVLIWPLTLLMIVLAFKTSIARLIERIEEGEIPNFFKLRAGGMDQQVSTLSDQPQGEDFRTIVSSKENEISALQTSHDDLKNQLITSQIQLDFERIYNIIFSNQIELLKQVNELNNGEVSFEFVTVYFAGLQSKFPSLQDWNITKYLEFLVFNQLLEYKTNVGNFISVAITIKGRAFISYINARCYNKVGL